MLRRLVVPHLPGFARLYPDVEVDLHASDEPADVIRDGIDVALHVGKAPGEDLEYLQLTDLPQVLCASPDYLEEEGRPSQPSHLKDHICLGHADEEYWRLVNGRDNHIIRINSRLRTNCSDLIREAALAGLGIALCPAAAIDKELANGSLLHVMPDWLSDAPSRLYAVLACREFMPAKVEAFLDFFKSRIEGQPEQQSEKIRALA
ncbi:MAG: substrate binding domain-containing protein [Hyphomicrobiaceae bacterium]